MRSPDHPRRAMDDVERLKDHYAQRARTQGDRYHVTQADVAIGSAEIDVAILRTLREQEMTDFAGLRVLEVGSGSGGNLLRMLRWGFRPEHLTGCELLTERHEQALAVMPPEVRLVNGDARTLAAVEDHDIVLQSTVLSSILDDEVQESVAATMWRALRPGGLVLSIDFTMNNPHNPHVRGVPRARLAQLFPGELTSRRVLLAPPIARRVGWHPAVHAALRAIPLLRTHLVATIRKPPPGQRPQQGAS